MLRITLVFLVCLHDVGLAMAQNNVVVVPLYGDDILPPQTRSIAPDTPLIDNYQVGANQLTVFDRTTGLTWQREDDNVERSWEEAFSYCASLILSNESDWRLPSPSELVSILSAGVPGGVPSINVLVFPNTDGASYWTSAKSVASINDVWVVDFATRRVIERDKGGPNGSDTFTDYYTRCVR